MSDPTNRDHLVMRDVLVEFNGFHAIDGFNFKVKRGELRCLIGPNGAGKTTTLDLICGKIRPTSGAIVLGDVHLTNLEEHEIARAGIGRKFQVPSVFHELTVRENIEVAFSRNTGVFANLLPTARREQENRFEELAEMVGLQDLMDHPAGHLSHGQTQWLEVALVLAQSPELILMDEPTAGMTRAETVKTAALFNRLKGKHTLVVVEHDMGFVKDIGDVITVMHQGRLLAEGTVSEVEQDARVKEVYLGSQGMDRA